MTDIKDLPSDERLRELADQLIAQGPTVETLRLVVANMQASLALADQLDALHTANLEVVRAVARHLEDWEANKAEWRRAAAHLMTTCAQLAEQLTQIGEADGD